VDWGAQATQPPLPYLQRLPLIKRPTMCLALLGRDGGLHCAGAHAVGTDAVLGEIVRAVACQLHDGALHRGVGGAVGLLQWRGEGGGAVFRADAASASTRT